MSTIPEQLSGELENWFLKKGIEKVLGRKFQLSSCPFTPKEIELAEKKEELILCLPKGLGRKHLGELFGIGNWVLRQRGIKGNVEDEDVWFSTPNTLEPPYLEKSALELEKIFRAKEVDGLSLEMYLVFAAWIKDTTGHVPDLKKSTWLLRTTYDLYERPLILSAGFFSENRMVADTRNPEDAIFNLGGRYARRANSHAMFLEVGKIEDFPEGVMRKVTLKSVSILAVNIGGKMHAIGDRCPHEGHSLADGRLENYLVRCPSHGASFDLHTGEIVELPLGEPEFSGFKGRDAQVFEVKIKSGKVIIRK